MRWYVADKDYIKYLRTIDSKVQEIDYKTKFKPYFGIVFEINDYSYYLPVSSARPKHTTMKNGKDFHKIVDTKDGTLISIININNMVPMPNEYIKELWYKDIDQYRTFKDNKDRDDYIRLLRKELYIIKKDREIIKKNAESLYRHVESNPSSNLSQRCCNFKLLENGISGYKPIASFI